MCCSISSYQPSYHQCIRTGGRVLRSFRRVRLHLTHPEVIPEHVFRGRGGGEGADEPGGENQVRGEGEGGGQEGGGFEAGQDQGGQDRREADELPEAGRAQAEDGRADDGFRPGQGERAGYSLCSHYLVRGRTPTRDPPRPFPSDKPWQHMLNFDSSIPFDRIVLPGSIPFI